MLNLRDLAGNKVKRSCLNQAFDGLQEKSICLRCMIFLVSSDVLMNKTKMEQASTDTFAIRCLSQMLECETPLGLEFSIFRIFLHWLIVQLIK